MQDLEGLLERLIVGGVEFTLIGGFAAVAHGATMMTYVIDVACPMDQGNLELIQKCLEDLHPKITRSNPPLFLSDALKGGGPWKNLYLETDLGRLDCLSRVEGIGDYEKVRERSLLIDLPWGPCRILDLGGLIQSKKALGRPKDLPVVAQLEALKQRGDIPPPEGEPGAPGER